MIGTARVTRLHPCRVMPDHPRRVQAPGTCRPLGLVTEMSYEFRIKGRVSRAVLESFEGLASDLEPVETVLHGPVRDQAELHGLLDRIQALGLELIEVRRLPQGG